jgi:predicted aspartyl protease
MERIDEGCVARRAHQVTGEIDAIPKMLIFWGFLAIIFVFPHPTLGDTQNWPADCKLTAVAQLPMTLKSGHVVISALANGKDLALGIDTGGFGSSLTKAGADHLGMVAPYSARLGGVVAGIGGLWVSEGNVHLYNLQIGDLELHNLKLPVMMAFPGVDGLIGPDILGGYDAEYDFARETFSLYRSHPCSDHAVSWTASYTVIPFTLTRSGHVRIPITLDGQKAYAILDTGAGVSVLSMGDANSMFGLSAHSPNVEGTSSISGFSWRKPVNAYGYTFKTLTLGGIALNDPRIELVNGRNFLGNDFASLVLGTDVLSRFHLYIAYRQQKLYVTDARAREDALFDAK